MSKKPTNAEQVAAQKTERLAVAKAKLLDDTSGAISVDTCIFTETGYRLDSGILKHLEQFKDNAFQLVFSEMTIREIHGHIAKDSDEAKAKLISALRSIGKYWNVQSDKQSSVVDELLGADTAKSMASKRVNEFSVRCGAQVIEAKETLDVKELIRRYFNLHPPFESCAEKKSEFPDAIAVLSLQAWAKNENTAVLFVTKDKGCHRFCTDSEYIFSIDNLGEALTLIQERDNHCSELCKQIEAKIQSGNYPELIGSIEDAVKANIWAIDWVVEADSYYSYDPDLQEVEVLSAAFSGQNGQAKFRAVDYRNETLVVHTPIKLVIDASCNFSFSIHDSIDHDMVNIGGANSTISGEVEIGVLLTFDAPSTETPEVVEIEIVPSYQTIEFGHVEPDYGEEDPNSEYY